MQRKTMLAVLGLPLIVAAALTVGQLPGCGGGGGGGTPTGTLQVGITDAPSQTFTHVFINISSVKVAPREVRTCGTTTPDFRPSPPSRGDNRSTS